MYWTKLPIELIGGLWSCIFSRFQWTAAGIVRLVLELQSCDNLHERSSRRLSAKRVSLHLIGLRIYPILLAILWAMFIPTYYAIRGMTHI